MSVGIQLLVGLAGVLIGAVILYYLLLMYNSLVILKNSIRKNWANIDVLLTQRAELVPNLVETVKGYMKHEKEIIKSITESRASMLKAKTLSDKAVANNELSRGLEKLFALAEGYPKLRANENFLKLQEQLATIENQIADRRELYNDSVNIYNTRIESIPDMIFARLLGYKKEEYFKTKEEERKEVEVKLDNP